MQLSRLEHQSELADRRPAMRIAAMLKTLAASVPRWVIGDDSPELRVQIFRLGSFTSAVLALLVVPLNFAAHLPLIVHVATVAMGAAHLAFFAASRLAGRTLCGTSIVASIAILDTLWFANGGSHGSITFYFLPLLLFSFGVFRGRAAAGIAAAQIANAVALLVVEQLQPGWITPLGSSIDRLWDLSTGITSAAIATAMLGWLIIHSHSQEQLRLAALAERLAGSERRYREVFDSTSDAIFIHAEDGRLLDMNERARSLFGFGSSTPGSLSVNEWSLGEPPYSAAEAGEKIAAALAGTPQVFEWLSRRASGELFWSEVGLRRGVFEDRGCAIASVRDITARKLVQHELLANEERLRLAMLASRQGWFEINVQTGAGISSPEYPRILGYEPGEFITSVQGWLDALHPDERSAIEREFRACIATGDTRAIEYRRRTKSGGWKWIRSVGRVVDRDAAGRPLRMVGMHTDITEQKELEAQLLHSQRLEAVGTLASGVAHDLNNILTPMLVGAGLLREKLSDPEDRETVSMMESTGRRGAAIVKQLLAFSRAVVPERHPLHPADLMREVLQLLRSTFPKEITIVEQIAETPCQIEGDSTQLHQVLVNLAVNARDAMAHGGTLTLGLEVCLLRPPLAEAVGSPPESFLVLRVGDTGPGIPPEIRDRIFDPFFTTKGPGKGTGLGLATVHGIVTAHRGFIRFETGPGRGTEFRVYLPITREPLAASRSKTPAHETPGPRADGVPLPTATTGTVLLVDDEPAVLRTTRRMLERDGYEVLATANGAEAIQIMRERADDIDLVITDFMMPDLDGPTLIPHLRAIKPSVKVIGVSGLDQSTRAAELGLADVLAKPFDGPTLLASARRVLAE